MALINYEIAVRESELSLKEMEGNEQRARFRDYIRFIRYLKTGEAKSQQESGSKIGLKSRQSQNLWSRYKKEGISGLLEERRKGSMGHLSYVQISHLQNFLRASIHPLTLLLDKATCHTAATKKNNLDTIFFPPACPELNPVERFFKEVRKELKSRVFQSLSEIELNLEAILAKYWQNPKAVISITSFPYFNTQ
ncbi:MAG: transposase [Bacteroidetes bacterium]|nr:transposase [Bacteroidota bacterium]